MRCLAAIVVLLMAAGIARARDPYVARQRFFALWGVVPATGVLHTAPKYGNLGAPRSVMTDKLLLSYAVSVHSRFADTEQTFHGSCRNLDTKVVRNVRIEVVRTPLAGVNMGRAEVVQTQPLGDLQPQGCRQVAVTVRYPGSSTVDYKIRVAHD